MSTDGWRVVAWVWLTLQFVQGCAAIFIPLYAFSDVLKGQTHGALVLMIGASCLGPVAMATWGSGNRLLEWGTGVAAAFTFAGASITLWSLLKLAVGFWIVFNIYALSAVVPFVFAVLYFYGAIRRRALRIALKSTVSPQGELTLYVSRRGASGSGLSLPGWFRVWHFLNFPLSRSRLSLPRWFYVTHFFRIC